MSAVGTLPKLLCITDRLASAQPLPERIDALCAAGVRLVQLREKGLDDRSLYELAIALRQVTARYGALLLINDRVDIALAADADGVVLPELGLPVQVARAIKPEWIIVRSVHSVSGAKDAQDAGADFLLFGHIFETLSKPTLLPRGLDALSDVVRSVSIPVFAVGGITPERVASCVQAGAFGVAAISGLMQAPCAQTAVHAFLRALASASIESKGDRKTISI